MGVDKNTKPSHVCIAVSQNEKYLDLLKKNARDMEINKEDKFYMCVSEEFHNFETEEIYFENGKMNISGTLINENGDTFFSLTIPVSDTVLIDILNYSLKKFNKLKSTMESLK